MYSSQRSTEQQESQQKTPYIVKVVLLGPARSGKSALLASFCQNTFRKDYKSTIGVDFAVKNVGDYKFQIWDTAGDERFGSVIVHYYRGAHAFILTIDLTQDWSECEKQIEEQLEKLKDYRSVLHPKIKLLIVGTNRDRLTLDEATARAQQLTNFVAQLDDPPAPVKGYMLVSSKTSENIDSLEQSLLNIGKNFYAPEAAVPLAEEPREDFAPAPAPASAASLAPVLSSKTSMKNSAPAAAPVVLSNNPAFHLRAIADNLEQIAKAKFRNQFYSGNPVTLLDEALYEANAAELKTFQEQFHRFSAPSSEQAKEYNQIAERQLAILCRKYYYAASSTAACQPVVDFLLNPQQNQFTFTQFCRRMQRNNNLYKLLIGIGALVLAIGFVTVMTAATGGVAFGVGLGMMVAGGLAAAVGFLKQTRHKMALDAARGMQNKMYEPGLAESCQVSLGR